MLKNQKKAYQYGLCAVALWSTVATAFKISLAYFEPVQLLLVAAITSTLTLGSIVAIPAATAPARSRRGRS